MMDTPATETAIEQAPELKKNWALLAQEEFGTGFHGEVPEAAEVATEEAAEVIEDAATEQATESPESEEVPIRSFEELTKHYEFDPEWVETLEIPVKINGEEGKATLADLKASYQIKEAAEDRLREAKERARAETVAIVEKRDQLNSQFAAVASVLERAEKSILGDEQSINWKELREQDPAEWTAKKAEFAQRKAELEQWKQEAVNGYKSSMAQSQQEAKEQQAQYLQEQAQQLVEKLPEWKDPETAKAEKTAVAEYLLSSGFAQEDIAAASDHRMIILARKAMLYDKGKDKSELIQKKVTKIPKVLKPGSPKSNEQLSKERLSQLRSKVQNTGSLDAALELMRAKRG